MDHFRIHLLYFLKASLSVMTLGTPLPSKLAGSTRNEVRVEAVQATSRKKTLLFSAVQFKIVSQKVTWFVA